MRRVAGVLRPRVAREPLTADDRLR